MTNPWDQLPKESPAAFEAFRVYKELGSRRTIEKAAAALLESQNQKGSGCAPKGVQDPALPNLSALKKLSRRHRWVDRSHAWDSHLSALRDAVLEQHARVQAEREIGRSDQLWEASQKAYQRIMDALASPMFEVVMEVDPATGRAVKIVKPTKWRFGDIPALLKAFVEMRDEATGHRHAVARGEPSEPHRPLFVEVVDVRREDPSSAAQPPTPKEGDLES